MTGAGIVAESGNDQGQLTATVAGLPPNQSFCSVRRFIKACTRMLVLPANRKQTGILAQYRGAVAVDRYITNCIILIVRVDLPKHLFTDAKAI